MKGKATVRNGVLIRTGPVQLDYPSKANSADEKGARNLEPTDIRPKVISNNCSIDVRYQGLICGEGRSLKQIPPPQGQIVASGRAVLVVDGFMDACDKCIGSELDLTDVIEDNMVDFGEERKNIKVAIEGTGVGSAKSRSDHYVISVLVDQEIGLMQRPAKDIEQ